MAVLRVASPVASDALMTASWHFSTIVAIDVVTGAAAGVKIDLNMMFSLVATRGVAYSGMC